MRVDVKKYLFIGLAGEKEKFFKKAQEAGIINFIDTRLEPSSQIIPPEVQDTSTSIKILRHLPTREQEENFDLQQTDTVIHEILSLNEENEKLLEDLRVLRLEMARVEMFGDFSRQDIHYIEQEGKRCIQFFCARPSLFQDQPVPEELVYVASENNLDYFVSINSHPVSFDKMIEIKIEHPLGELRQQFSDTEKKQKDVERSLKEYAKYSDRLHQFLILQLNKYHLDNAQTYVQQAMDGTIFAIDGWVPENEVAGLDTLFKDMHVHMEEIAIEPTDSVPTYLENHGFNKLGEDLISIYDTPSASDKDPSLWVLGSFAVFFAFIVGDAGYGLVYLAIALYLRYKFPHVQGVGKRMINLLTFLSIGCIVWGTVMTSFFGMEIAPHNPLRKVSIMQWMVEKKATYHIQHSDETFRDFISKYPDLKNVTNPHEFASYVQPEGRSPVLSALSDNVLFELALFVGVVHIILSLLRYIKRNWQGAGWIAFLIGAYLYFAAYLNVPSFLNYIGGIDLVNGGAVGFDLMIGGIIFAVIGSVIKHGFIGIFEVMALIQVFADILSYLRLYALALAGAIVASTINGIASGIPLILAIVLIVISHITNIVLSTMSGVIHGLRLNFIEWYHYSFEGGGKQFRPLKLLKIK